MADEGTSRAAKVAIGLAIAAFGVAIAAGIVVVTRGSSSPRPVAPVSVDEPQVEAVTVDAQDVVRMDRGTVEPVVDPAGASGVRISDPDLLATLQLDARDVITAISGKPVRRQFDVYDALLGAGMMNATTLYIELVRGGRPRLVKWELEGDLRQARTGQGRTTRVAPAPVAPDPLVDTIKRITDFEFELPRSTLAMLGTQAMSGRTAGARAIPAMRNGSVEGVKLYAIRPGSVWAALGLNNGDTITSVNNRPVLTATMRDEFARLQSASTLEASVMRRGKPISLKYSITK